MSKPYPSLSSEFQELLERWVRAIEGKDLEALKRVFRSSPDVMVFWSNGERNRGWDEVRHHIEADFLQDVELSMTIDEPRSTSMGDDAAILTYRYRITLTAEDDSMSFSRLASMGVHRDAEGWRVASLHVSTTPQTAES